MIAEGWVQVPPLATTQRYTLRFFSSGYAIILIYLYAVGLDSLHILASSVTVMEPLA